MTIWLAMVLAAVPARGLSDDEVADVFALHAAEFEPCFNAVKNREKASATLHLEVNDDRVSDSRWLQSTELDSRTGSCIARALEDLEFPHRENAETLADWTFTAATSRPIEPEAATPVQLATLDEQLIACYTFAPFSEATEGTITLDLSVMRSGEIAAVSLIEQSKPLELIHLDGCLQGRLPGLSLEKSSRPRHLRAAWVLATSARRVKALTVAGEKRREIVPARGAFVARAPAFTVRHVLHENRADIQRCYQSGLKKNPDLSGRVTLKWKINADGRAGEVSVARDTLGDVAVTSCMIERLKTWSFAKPAAGGETGASAPWVFRPPGK